MRFSTILIAAPLLHSAMSAPTHGTNPEITPGHISVSGNSGKSVTQGLITRGYPCELGHQEKVLDEVAGNDVAQRDLFPASDDSGCELQEIQSSLTRGRIARQEPEVSETEGGVAVDENEWSEVIPGENQEAKRQELVDGGDATASRSSDHNDGVAEEEQAEPELVTGDEDATPAVEPEMSKRAVDILSNGPESGTTLSAQILAVTRPFNKDTPTSDILTGLDVITAALQGRSDGLQLGDGQSPVDSSEAGYLSEMEKDNAAADTALVVASIHEAIGRLSPEQQGIPDTNKRLCALDVILEQYLNILNDKSAGLLIAVGPLLCTLSVTLESVLDKVSCLLKPTMDQCLGQSLESVQLSKLLSVLGLGSAESHTGSNRILGVTA